jgi:drug/metabolite transporter (DMT)-like permease
MLTAWSINFLAVKVGLRHFAPLTLASFRLVLAGLIMLPVYLIYVLNFGPPVRASETSGTRRQRFDRRDLWRFVQLGLLGVTINQFCFTVGLNYTTVGHSALIIGTGPILILLMAWALGLEAMTLKKVLGMALSFGGVAVLAAEHGISLHSGTLLGDLITLTGSLAFALYTVLGKRVAAQYDTLSMNAFNYFTGAVLLLPLAAWEAVRLSRTGSWGAVGWQGWAALGYMSVVASVLAYLIYFWILQHMTATRLSAFSYLLPVLTTLLGIVLLGEKLTRSLLVGGALVLAGIYLIESGPRENQREGKYVYE